MRSSRHAKDFRGFGLWLAGLALAALGLVAVATGVGGFRADITVAEAHSNHGDIISHRGCRIRMLRPATHDNGRNWWGVKARALLLNRRCHRPGIRVRIALMLRYSGRWRVVAARNYGRPLGFRRIESPWAELGVGCSSRAAFATRVRIRGGGRHRHGKRVRFYRACPGTGVIPRS